MVVFTTGRPVRAVTAAAVRNTIRARIVEPSMKTSVLTRHRWWWQPLGISLLLVLVFIGLYVGFQRSPRPYQVPVAVAGTSLQAQFAGATGPAVAVVPVADQAAGDAL